MTSYGFVIDNNKCIGCHACTVACKAEHNVPVGVFRTWVKYIETGEFPDVSRLFSVMRCNHCEDAPCVSICPVSALYTRDDGIVDFNKDRCIACKSCMQACPYDALYIDPQTMTSAKCNFCANRVEQNLQPACVVVCPEEAIIAGDLDNPHSTISKTISQNQVTVRKPEKGTNPKLFYIDGDNKVLLPTQTSRTDNYMWSSQSKGVGHYSGKEYSNKPMYKEDVQPKSNRAYDVPKKGRLWGYEFPAYIITKSVSTGIIMIITLFLLNRYIFSYQFQLISFLVALGFLGLTGVFLILDLDQPTRFYYIILRPQWKSWLTRGTFLILSFGTFILILLLFLIIPDILYSLFNSEVINLILAITFVLAILTSVYTAFLLAQAKGRDFWQSPLLPFGKLSLSIALGGGILVFISKFTLSFRIRFIAEHHSYWHNYDQLVFITSIGILGILFISLAEVFITHSTADSSTVAQSFKSGSWKFDYWGGLLVGAVIPFILVSSNEIIWITISTISLFVGLYVLMRAWIYAPQDISLV